MKETVKITFTGDIMCEKPLQRAYDKYGAAAFGRVFAGTKALLGASDLAVGNLETVFGGPAQGYTRALYRFNTPDPFAAAIAEGGFGLVTTATNHCLDGGVAGLVRTLGVLDRCGLAHTGTNAAAGTPRYLVMEVGGRRVAFLNYTYGTNMRETGVVLGESELHYVNLLKPQTRRLQTYEGAPVGKARLLVSSALPGFVGDEARIRLKKLLGMAYNVPRTDHLDPDELDGAYLRRAEGDLLRAKEEADAAIVCLHCGGQFNREPGELSRHFAAFFARRGAAAVVCHHAHVVQRAERVCGVPVAYCLGNYSISPSSVYLLREGLPEYAVALHLYLGGEGVERTTFSVLKICEDRRRIPSPVPCDELFAALKGRERAALVADVNEICRRFTGRAAEHAAVQREYDV